MEQKSRVLRRQGNPGHSLRGPSTGILRACGGDDPRLPGVRAGSELLLGVVGEDGGRLGSDALREVDRDHAAEGGENRLIGHAHEVREGGAEVRGGLLQLVVRDLGEQVVNLCEWMG
jgi:hypothetical protein